MRSRGFTLMELLVAMAIIALFATLAVPLTELAVNRTKEGELRAALREIRMGLDAYKQAVDEGRIMIRAGDSGYPKDLMTLVDGVEDAKSPIRAKLKFLRQIPRDPFADEGTSAENSWALRSFKSDAKTPMPGDDVFDVHSRSTETGLNGIPYREW